MGYMPPAQTNGQIFILSENYIVCWHQNIQQFTIQTHRYVERKGLMYNSIEMALKYTLL
jgi:hypothetical protein